MRERIQTLNEMKEKICSRLLEARAKVDTLNEILKIVQLEIETAEYQEQQEIKRLQDNMNNNDLEFGD